MPSLHRVSLTIFAAAFAFGCGSSTKGTTGSSSTTGSGGGSTTASTGGQSSTSSSMGTGGAGTGGASTGGQGTGGQGTGGQGTGGQGTGGQGTGGQGTGGSAPLWCATQGSGHYFCDDFSGSLKTPWDGFFALGSLAETSNAVDFTSPPAADAFAVSGGGVSWIHSKHRYGNVPKSTTVAFDLRSTLAFSSANGGQIGLVGVLFPSDVRVEMNLGKDGLSVQLTLAGATKSYPVSGAITPGAWTRVTLAIGFSSGTQGTLDVKLGTQSGLAVSAIQTTSYTVGASTTDHLDVQLGINANGSVPAGEIDFDNLLWDVTP